VNHSALYAVGAVHIIIAVAVGKLYNSGQI
jgi:hypothetical protein